MMPPQDTKSGRQMKWPGQSPGRLQSIVGGVALRRYDNGRAQADSSIEIENVGVVHSDAAVGDIAANRARIVGAVDGVLAAGKRHRRGAHGVSPAAAGNDVRQIWLVVLYLGG